MEIVSWIFGFIVVEPIYYQINNVINNFRF